MNKKWKIFFVIVTLSFSFTLLQKPLAADNKEVANSVGWVQEEGTWFYYNEDGTSSTGWHFIKDNWFYFYPETGVMATGLTQVGQDLFFLHPNLGNMQKKWQYVNQKWYYFHPTLGNSQHNWQLIKNQWYYLSPTTGAMATNWLHYNNHWYFLDGKNGQMKTGWQLVGNKWYYFNPNGGQMQTGWLNLKGKTYYLSSSGAMLTGRHNISNTWYTFNSSGALVVSPDAIWQEATGTQPNLSQYSNLSVGVSIAKQRVYIYSNQQQIYEIICSTGLPGMETPTGNYRIQAEKGYSFGGIYGGAKYYRSFLGHGVYLFHSVPIDGYGNYIPSEGRKLGNKASHGCIRMPVPDAIWFYNQIPYNTPVHIY